MSLPAILDPERLATTRGAWHAVAEHVVAPVRHRAVRRIGLQVTPGGFGTGPLPDVTEVRVAGGELVVGSTHAPLTTLGDAARAAGLDGPVDLGLYAAQTPADPDRALTVDPAAADALAAWYALGAAVLARWRAEAAGETPTDATLWPEHFDLALDLGAEGHRANYGASPGDPANPLPYLYVGPWEARAGDFWDAGTYARLPYDELRSSTDPEARALEFFARGHALA